MINWIKIFSGEKLFEHEKMCWLIITLDFLKSSSSSSVVSLCHRLAFSLCVCFAFLFVLHLDTVDISTWKKSYKYVSGNASFYLSFLFIIPWQQRRTHEHTWCIVLAMQKKHKTDKTRNTMKTHAKEKRLPFIRTFIHTHTKHTLNI